MMTPERIDEIRQQINCARLSGAPGKPLSQAWILCDECLDEIETLQHTITTKVPAIEAAMVMQGDEIARMRARKVCPGCGGKGFCKVGPSYLYDCWCEGKCYADPLYLDGEIWRETT